MKILQDIHGMGWPGNIANGPFTQNGRAELKHVLFPTATLDCGMVSNNYPPQRRLSDLSKIATVWVWVKVAIENHHVREVYPLVIWHSCGKSLFFMGQSTISIAIFHSYVNHYQRVKHPSNFIQPPFSYGFSYGKSSSIHHKMEDAP